MIEHEEKYKHALERAKAVKETYYNLGNISAISVLESIFPELKESEDERIRKEIISYIKSSGAVTNPNWIAWLEKQGEQILDKLLSSIDSLPEESGCEVNFTTKSEDLEEELHNFLIEQGPMATLERCAKHFAEWQKEKHKTQYGFLNLKDCKDAYNEWKSTQDNPSAALAWVRACEWQKQQMKETLQTEYEKGRFDMREEMMKDAVDAFVNTYENTDDSNYVEFVTEQSPYKFKETEKCKLIIVKEKHL